jgi:hypothetical protein
MDFFTCGVIFVAESLGVGFVASSAAGFAAVVSSVAVVVCSADLSVTGLSPHRNHCQLEALWMLGSSKKKGTSLDFWGGSYLAWVYNKS